MANFSFERAQPWAPHPDAAPLTEAGDGDWLIGANGTGTCAGDGSCALPRSRLQGLMPLKWR